MQVTYLPNPGGGILCVWPFFYPTIKVAILQRWGAVENIWKKDRLKITEGRNKKKILEEKEYDRKEDLLTN